MRVLITGSEGFLGWHSRVRLRALTEHEVIAVDRSNWADLGALAAKADAIVHVAGINRGTPVQMEHGNVDLAQEVANALRGSSSVKRVIYANSIWAGTASPYGVGKASANFLLAEAASEAGAHYVDVRLPNLFGEHGRPRYNSFVATFVNAVITGSTPEVVERPINLLHVQEAAQLLIDALSTSLPHLEPIGTPTSVNEVYEKLQDFASLYASGDIPPLQSDFDVDLFNTLRAAMFPDRYPIGLTQHRDERGRLVETVRAHGGQGQTFMSTTRPGITRGEHFHLRKVERFVVISGRASISLRKVFSDRVVTFDVDGEEPAVVDMPTMWVHNITNIGDSELVTLFWTHTLFDPEAPDTYWEPVSPHPGDRP
jgi:UDP-2-acetamido-2,6-beta-L-arabino-hexul-4-ose reductase